MNAEIVAAGSELLTPAKIDTNSLYLTQKLNDLGIEVIRKTIVGDDRILLRCSIESALASADLVIVTGGLGPTEDDVTRDAAAEALKRKQTLDPSALVAITELFRSVGRKMAEINRRQAFLIEGAELLPNSRGTAPGQWISQDKKVLVLLPGPPKELTRMFEHECLPRLERLVPPQVIKTLVLRAAGMGESDVDQAIAPVYTRYSNPATTILASPGDIQIHLRARCPTGPEAEALLTEVSDQILPILGDAIYTKSGQSLEEVVLELLKARSETVCTAESCTGGLIAQRLTSVPGSSGHFAGGFVTYTEEMKTRALGVPAGLIQEHTAVSEPVAREMASNARTKAGTTFGISVTGFAGPDGGTPENPVGTVYIGVADANRCDVKRLRWFSGDRERIRTLAAQTALNLLRLKLLIPFRD